MQPLQKPGSNDSLDYSFLFNKLDQLSRENTLYRQAFSQIEEVANKITGGNLAARITHWDEFGKTSPALSAINNAYDFVDNFILESETAQQKALINQDEFRKRQLKELKDYFVTKVAPALR